MQLDLTLFPYPGRRQPIYARNGAVATSQPLAAQAGLRILQQGGNAVDAALATAIALTVVEPASNDVGGDVFAQVWDGSQLHGLNGSGRAPAALTPAAVRAQGYPEMPGYGWYSVTVPGAPAAWRDLHQRFGRLPFETLFKPAIGYAEQGYAVTPALNFHWNCQAEEVHPQLHGPEYAAFADLFLPGGRAPKVGEIWRNPDLAQTLRLLARTSCDALYHGELAETIATFAAQTGGLLTVADFAQHTSTWVDPISTNYRGYDVWELPPNGQGLTVLLALNILEGFDLRAWPRETPESYHLQLEALKLAFADAQRYIADPEHSSIPLAGLLSKDYAARRRTLIGDQALLPEPGDPLTGGTVYLCATDASGMMVSFIQSNYDSFGSHVVVPGTGMSLQNRASAFTLEEGHPNCLAPGKRPFHSIIPGFLTRDGQALGPFGVMGGHMQPQGHLQMVVNTIDYNLNPQASLDAPRWFWGEERYIQVEPGVSPQIVEGLRQRGHEVFIDEEIDFVGCGQIIWRLPNGVYVAGSEGRTDGCAVGY